MAMPPQKTGGPQSAGNPHQSAVALGQAAGGNSSAELNDNESGETETDEQLAKAWGFSVKRPRLSKEALIGLTAILALLGLFGFVVVRHFRNRSVVAEKTDKVDPNVQPAGNEDPFGKDATDLNNELSEFSNNSQRKNPAKSLNIEDELGIGDGQSEPGQSSTNVTSRKPALPRTIEDEFEGFDSEPQPKTNSRRAQLQPAETAEDVPEFDHEPPAKTNRNAGSLTLDFEENPRPEKPALTKTTEPIRLKQPVEPQPSLDEQFEEPVRVDVAKRPREDFETIPQRTRKPVHVAQQDAFAEPTVFDDPKANAISKSQTSNLKSGSTGSRGTKRHPLLNDGEYLVEEGDNFCVISKKLYGSEKFYLALAEHNRNRVADPCRMRPGLIIMAPPATILEQQHSALIPKPKKSVEIQAEKPQTVRKISARPLPQGLFYDSKGAPWYRVGKGDTLSEIAQAHLGRTTRAEQIYNLNRERLPNRDKLDVGQELRLPNDASQVRLVEVAKPIR